MSDRERKWDTGLFDMFGTYDVECIWHGAER